MAIKGCHAKHDDDDDDDDDDDCLSGSLNTRSIQTTELF
jgi:hypothetical protein